MLIGTLQEVPEIETNISVRMCGDCWRASHQPTIDNKYNDLITQIPSIRWLMFTLRVISVWQV